jgi:hypothetical protein
MQESGRIAHSETHAVWCVTELVRFPAYTQKGPELRIPVAPTVGARVI